MQWGRKSTLWAYSLALAALAGLGFLEAVEATTGWPAPVTWAGWVAFNVFILHWGVPSRYFGLLSLERFAQVGAVLAFGVAAGAAVNASTSLIYPFTSRAYNQGSPALAALRAVHNAAMVALMSLAAGHAYVALGGTIPLATLGWRDLVPLTALALVMQVVNIGLMAAYFRLDRRDVRKMLTPAYVSADLLFVPGGVLVALLYANLPAASFVLFIALLLAFVVSVNAFARSRDVLATRVAELDKAGRAGHALGGARGVDEVVERVRREVGALFKYDEFHLVLRDAEQGDLDFRLHWCDGERRPRRRKPLGEGLFGWAIQAGNPVLVEDWSTAPAELRDRAVKSAVDPGAVMAVPLKHAGKVVGLVAVQNRAVGAYGEDDLNLLAAFAERIAPAIMDARTFEELESYRTDLERRVAERTAELETVGREREALLEKLRDKTAQLERLSHEDPLTGLANRRQLDARLEAELARAGRYGHALAVALADLDRFKDINDTLGHAVGDEVLRVTAAVLRQHCRAIDVIARYGGEEFALVFPETDAAGARLACEKIRVAVSGYPWREVHPELAVTISAGVFEWRRDMDAPGLLERADEQLYAAKREGRNRVVG